jgi:thiol-disulfide isomerase/thioredoxin
MRQIKFLISFCIIVSSASAQSKIVKPLKIGEAVPNLTFSMLNYKKASAKISDFKGKILILDFWSTWCANCIEEFPKLTTLQEEFKDSIVILTVGFQQFSENNILHFINTRKGTERELKLPTAVIAANDKTLEKLFPHQGLPLEIWIDKKGKFIAATDQFCVTFENIHKLLTGENP